GTSDHTVTTVESTAYTFTSTDFPFTDPDSDGETLQSVTIVTLPGSGTRSLKRSAGKAGKGGWVANINTGKLGLTPAAGATGNPYTTFTFTVSDGTASSSQATETVVVTPTPPGTSDHTVTTVESTAYTFTSADFPFTDPDSDGETLQSVTIVTLPGSGT